MELHFLKKTTAVTLLITALVCGLTTAAPVGHACNSTVYSYCNEATSSSQVNETLKSLVTEADEILSQIDDVCKEINVCKSLYYICTKACVYTLFYYRSVMHLEYIQPPRLSVHQSTEIS